MEYILAGILVFALLFIFVFSRESLSEKGSIGERLVKRKLRRVKGYKKVFNNVLIGINGKSVQIDHILISKGGIFVIETKNYTGTIKGVESSAYWTQFVGKYRNNFYNPIKQNETHIRFLKQHLENNPYYRSIVVFTGKEKLQTQTKTPTMSLTQLKGYINYQNKKRVISKERIEVLSKKLKKLQKENKITLKNHISKINNKK